MDLEVICLVKSQSSQDYFCSSKKGQKVKIWLYFDLLEAQNSMKTQGNAWAHVNLHEKSRNAEFSQNGATMTKGLTGGETR